MRIQKVISVLTGVVMMGALAVSPVASAAVDMFLKLDGILGETRDKVRVDEIDVLAWSWGTSRPTRLNCVSAQDITITKYTDKATPKLLARLVSGQPIPTGKLTVRKAGETTPLEYIVLDFSGVIVSAVSSGGSGGEDRLTENVTLSFASVNFTYTPQTALGKPGMPESADVANTCKN